MNGQSDGTATWLKVAGGLGSIVLLSSIGLITTALANINNSLHELTNRANDNTQRVVRIEAWRDNMMSVNTVPRAELDLRDKVIAAQMQQLELRIQEVERRK